MECMRESKRNRSLGTWTPNRVEYFMQAVTHISKRACRDKRFGNDEENFLRKPQTFHGMARGDYVSNIRLKELRPEKAEVLTQFWRKFIFSHLSASRPRKLQKFFLWLRNQRAYEAFHYFFPLSLRKFSRNLVFPTRKWISRGRMRRGTQKLSKASFP